MTNPIPAAAIEAGAKARAEARGTDWENLKHTFPGMAKNIRAETRATLKAAIPELLDQIEQLQAVVRDSHDNCTYQTRLAAVEKLHTPVEVEPSDTVCGHCSFQLPNGKYFGKIVEYPCETIKAVRGD